MPPPASTSRRSLTVRSRGQKQQAVFSLRASRYGAPYLGVRLLVSCPNFHTPPPGRWFTRTNFVIYAGKTCSARGVAVWSCARHLVMLWQALINSAVPRLLPYRFVMSQRISKPTSTKAQAGSPASTSLAGLTGRSRGQKQQAVFSLRASRCGAPYLWC